MASPKFRDANHPHTRRLVYVSNVWKGPLGHGLTAYQQKDEELAQSSSALAAAVGAVGANTCAMTV